jgi:hypothetical protein
MQGKLKPFVCYSIGLINVSFLALMLATDVYANPNSATQQLEGGTATIRCNRRADQSVEGAVLLRPSIGRAYAISAIVVFDDAPPAPLIRSYRDPLTAIAGNVPSSSLDSEFAWLTGAAYGRSSDPFPLTQFYLYTIPYFPTPPDFSFDGVSCPPRSTPPTGPY